MNRMTDDENIRDVHYNLLSDLINGYIGHDKNSDSYTSWKCNIKIYFRRPNETLIIDDMEYLEKKGFLGPGEYHVLKHIFLNIHHEAIGVIDKALQRIQTLRGDHQGIACLETPHRNTVAQIHIKVRNGDHKIESVLALILNTFGSLLDEMKYPTPLKKALNIIRGKKTRKKYKSIVKLINKAKDDLENTCRCETNPCSAKDILKDFLEFLINAKQQQKVTKWRIGWDQRIVILLQFQDMLSSTELFCSKMNEIKKRLLSLFQSILTNSGKLARGVPDAEIRAFLFKDITLSSMDFTIKSQLLQNEEQDVIDHINKENKCMDKDVSIVQRILNYLSLFGKLVCCRQVNSIGITIDFPSVVDMMRYKYGRTEEIINNEVSDLIMESSKCTGHTIEAGELSIEAYYSIGRDTDSGFDITSDLEIEPDDSKDIDCVDLYTTDIHNRMLSRLVKEFFGENESSEEYRLRIKKWKDFLEKQWTMTAQREESTIFQDFKYLEKTTLLKIGEYSILRGFFYNDKRSLRIIDVADESIELIKMIYSEESMQIRESQLDDKLDTYEILVHVGRSQLMDIILDFICELDSEEDPLYPIEVAIEIVETHSVPLDFLDLRLLVDKTLSSLSYVISQNLAKSLTQSENILHGAEANESADILHGGSNQCEDILHSILSLLKFFEKCQVNRRTFCWGDNCLVIIITLDNTEKFELDLLKEEITNTFESVLSVFNNVRSETIEVDCLTAMSTTEDDYEVEYVESATSKAMSSTEDDNEVEYVESATSRAMSTTEDDNKVEYVESATSNSNPNSQKVLLEN